MVALRAYKSSQTLPDNDTMREVALAEMRSDTPST